jgi:hypothetical protein
VSVGTLTPVLLTCMVTVFVSVSAAKAVRPFPIAIVLTAKTAAIATIATSAVFWFWNFGSRFHLGPNTFQHDFSGA